jgi:hypothetical protein
MSEAHAPRATDLVALVTFDGQVRENLAVTREHLGQERRPPRPLSAAIEQWLHLGRRTWVSVEGREVRGIATARELGDASAWELDALIDASDAGEERDRGSNDSEPRGRKPGKSEAPVLVDLLSRASHAAAEAEVTRLLLRTPSTVAAGAAVRAGFRAASQQQFWGCNYLEPGAPRPGVHVREASAADQQGAFQLYLRAVSAETRATMAMTLREWQSLQGRRWLGRRGRSLVAECDGRMIGHLRCAPATGQFDLLVDPTEAEVATDALLDAAVALIDAGRVTTLCETDAPQAHTLERRGMLVQQEFTLLSRRTATPLAEAAAVPVNARLA